MNEQLNKLLAKPWVIPTAVGVASGVVGFVAGYFTHKTLSEREVEEEWEEPEHDGQLEMDFDAPPQLSYPISGDTNVVVQPPSGLADQLGVEETSDAGREWVEGFIKASHGPNPHLSDGTIVENERRDPPKVIIHEDDLEPVDFEVTEPEVRTTVFMQDDDGWDDEAEMARRDPRHPYVIHTNEFHDSETGYDQAVLTYYQEDGILADPDNVPVYNMSDLIGPLKFGHGSAGDKNVFFVRNEQTRMEYEVIFDSGSFAEYVQGVDATSHLVKGDELRHSQLRRFRDED